MTDTPTKAEAPEMRACPFCGATMIHLQNGIQQLPNKEWYRLAWCVPCGAMSREYPTAAEAIMAWNTRTPATPDSSMDRDGMMTTDDRALADLKEAFEMAHALIQEAKGIAGDGSVTDHLDSAEGWIDKIEDVLEAFHAKPVVGEMCPTADELEASGHAPWQGRQPLEDHARIRAGEPWVPLDRAIVELQFWQRRDYEHSRSAALQPPPPVVSLPLMSAAFRTTVTGSGGYAIHFKFPTMEALHAADDEWIKFRKDGQCTDGFAQSADGSTRHAIGASTTATDAPPVVSGEALSPEWCLKMAELEGDAEIGAGRLDHPLRCPPIVEEGRREALTEVVKFLLGEGPLDGLWFADSHDVGARPRWWWRTHLRTAHDAILALTPVDSVREENARLRAALELWADSSIMRENGDGQSLRRIGAVHGGDVELAAKATHAALSRGKGAV